MTARIGYGTVIEVETAPGSGTYFTLAETFQHTPPSDSIDMVEATHFGSTDRRREFISGLTDGGSASMQMNYNPGSATDVFIRAWRAPPGLARAIRTTFPNGATVAFSGLVESYETDVPLGDRMTASLSVKVTGAVTLTGAAVPVNSVLPAISGVAQVGVTLTAYAGEWSGSPTFAYQWQQDSSGNGVFANISGATSSTYAPVTGNIGNRIRVGVVATNSAGSAAQVFSVPTVAVIAA
jgi:hypothetical protein